MPFIKAKNGNVVEFDDPDLGKRALKDEHEVFETDPRVKGSKPKKWSPEGSDADAAAGDE
ncbi:MAG: hypothetical protein KDB30_13390 [Tetrasphaera sp.]|nr:hypothetical protein [Tetrasphaera sp.]